MMPVVPAARLSRPHSNNAVLLWTGGENIRFFAAAGQPVFHKTSAVRAEQQETMQAVSGQFSSGHRNDRNSPEGKIPPQCGGNVAKRQKGSGPQDPTALCSPSG